MSTEIDRLCAMSQAEVRDHFRTTDVLQLAGTIRAADDTSLRRLLELEHVRAEGVAAMLERFGQFADAARLEKLSGLVRFELARGRRAHECHTARFDAGSVTLAPDATPDVTIRADLLDVARLVTGQSDAALLYLDERLRLDGDEMLALDLGSAFTVPGSDTPVVDPDALDPVDVATAVAASSGKHLRGVMGGGLRSVVLGQVVRRLPDFIDAELAREMRLTIGFRVSGRADGGVDHFAVHVAEGACRVETDPPEGQRRDATLTLEGADFLRLVTGQLHAVRGVLTGALKVRGDRGAALAFNGAMRPPQPRR